MTRNYISQSSAKFQFSRKSAGADFSGARHSMALLVWLSLMVLIIGLFSLLSYSLNASELIRPAAPSFAAWWEAEQFYFMEGGATALGLLLGIGIGNGMMTEPNQRFRARVAALVLASIAFAPLIHECSASARLGWNGRHASLASWIISREGYDVGRHVDKVLITAVYFSKTVAFAVLCGLGLSAISCAIVIVLDRPNREINQVIKPE